MRYRKLGKCSDKVSAIGLGGMAMTPIYGPVDPVEATAAVNAALDEGMNFIDTSDAYGGGKMKNSLEILSRGAVRTFFWLQNLEIWEAGRMGVPSGSRRLVIFHLSD